MKRVTTSPSRWDRTGAVPPADGSRLRVDCISVGYGDDASASRVVSNVSFSLERGKILGLVGETGCGKSTTALAAIGYRGRGARITHGRALIDDVDILTLDRPSLAEMWGPEVAYISQNAGTSLNPAMRVENHFAQVLRRHFGLTKTQARERAIELLDAVDIIDPPAALRRFPHQFSGGQQQRLSLAIALACHPGVLVLDEPTTGLDVTTQSHVSELFRSLVDETGVAALYVSHDIALLSKLADRICVMYAGQVVEEGPVDQLLSHPLHPYTRALLAAVPSVRSPQAVRGIPGEPPLRAVLDACPFAPRCDFAAAECRAGNPPMIEESDGRMVRCVRREAVERGDRPVTTIPEIRVQSTESPDEAGHTPPLLSVRALTCHYGKRRDVVAVRDASFEVAAGETLGVVGLSGSGKSTMLRALAGLHDQLEGEMMFDGVSLPPRAIKRPRRIRRDIQMVFQDPGSSLNPRHTVGQLVARPLQLFRTELSTRERNATVTHLLESVMLPKSLMSRYPWELSGGQQQRVAIARAFATEPTMLLCDEVTSALDVSVQAAVLDLIRDLADEHGTAVVFVSHDLAVVRTIASRAVVMLDGELVEEGRIDDLFTRPAHPYTAELLASVPDIGRAR